MKSAFIGLISDEGHPYTYESTVLYLTDSDGNDTQEVFDTGNVVVDFSRATQRIRSLGIPNFAMSSSVFDFMSDGIDYEWMPRAHRIRRATREDRLNSISYRQEWIAELRAQGAFYFADELEAALKIMMAAPYADGRQVKKMAVAA